MSMFLDYPLATNSLLELCILRGGLKKTPHSPPVIAQQAKPGKSLGSLSQTLVPASMSLGSSILASTPRLLVLRVNKLGDTVRELPGTPQGTWGAKPTPQPILILKTQAFGHLTRGVYVHVNPRGAVPNVNHLAGRVRDPSLSTRLLLRLHVHPGSILPRGLVLNINHLADAVRDPWLNTQPLLQLHVHLGSLLLRGAVPNVNQLVHLIWIPLMSIQTVFQVKIHSKGLLP